MSYIGKWACFQLQALISLLRAHGGISKINKVKGFSLVEILIALIIVSLTAANVAGLQKKLFEQQRNNFAHSAVITLAMGEMEKVLALETMSALTGLDNTSETDLQIGNTVFSVQWRVSEVSHIGAGSDFREVEVEISWSDAQGRDQHYSYSEQINLALLLSGASKIEITDQLAGIVVSALQTNNVIYFNSKMGYKKGAFVIYNSYLYKAISAHDVDNDPPHSVVDPNTGIERGSENWQSYGRIDNPELADDSELVTLFLALFHKIVVYT